MLREKLVPLCPRTAKIAYADTFSGTVMTTRTEVTSGWEETTEGLLTTYGTRLLK